MRTHTRCGRHARAAAPALALALAVTGPVGAAVAPYTDYDAYLGAIAGLAPEAVEGFDAVTDGTTLADGDSVGTVTFSAFDLFGADLQIVDIAGQTSSANNALETTLGSFVGGDGFSLTFDDPVTAMGLFVITGDSLVTGDLTLSIALGSVDLSPAHVITGQRLEDDFDFTDGTGTNLYFLGLVADAPFTTATLSSSDAASFGFSVDDLRSSTGAAAPLPATAALLLTGLVLPAARRCRRRHG
jgi:hypothetical protein